MANGSRIAGILVLVIIVCVAIAYTLLFNHRPATTKAGAGGTSTVLGSGTGTKIIVYNSTPGGGQGGQIGSTMPTSSAQTTFNQQVYSVPITITNLQPDQTPAGFQDMIVVPSLNYSSYIGQNWSNVEFTTGAQGGGSAIEAWIESNATPYSKATVVWLKLPMPIGGHNSTTIYMDFMNFKVLSRLGPTGEAPQLSTAYAQYDNGGRVFNFYDNFSGRTLNRNLWSNASALASNPITVNDGLTIGMPTSNQNNGYGAVISLQEFGQGVIDFYGTLLDNSTLPHYQGVGLVPASSNNACNLIAIGSFGSPGYSGMQTVDSYCNAKYSQGLGFGSLEIYSIFVPSISPTNATATLNYSGAITSSFTSIVLPQTLGFENQGSMGNLGPIYWIRQRDYPPGGFLPSASFGKVQ